MDENHADIFQNFPHPHVYGFAGSRGWHVAGCLGLQRAGGSPDPIAGYPI